MEILSRYKEINTEKTVSRLLSLTCTFYNKSKCINDGYLISVSDKKCEMRYLNENFASARPITGYKVIKERDRAYNDMISYLDSLCLHNTIDTTTKSVISCAVDHIKNGDKYLNNRPEYVDDLIKYSDKIATQDKEVFDEKTRS